MKALLTISLFAFLLGCKDKRPVYPVYTVVAEYSDSDWFMLNGDSCRFTNCISYSVNLSEQAAIKLAKETKEYPQVISVSYYFTGYSKVYYDTPMGEPIGLKQNN